MRVEAEIKITSPPPTFGYTLAFLSITVLCTRQLSAIPVIDFSADSYETNELDQYQLGFYLTANQPLTMPATVQVSVVGGTAERGKDYELTASDLFLESGFDRRGFMIFMHDDGISEPDETVKLQLTSVDGGAILGVRTNALLIIHNGAPKHWIAVNRKSADGDLVFEFTDNSSQGASFDRL